MKASVFRRSQSNLNTLRKRLLHCYVWPILLSGCESWTIKEDLRKRLEAFEMWAYRRMLKISWTQKVGPMRKSCDELVVSANFGRPS
ncbi:jg3602 [Pararge aegeria aegeria]|uniref:Jg3602 protein n=1 Tax=Pararge aegeria aegeria TaxID=348720 RepID=A0A8S4R504_9NEOP|nr:jg3602 [Pararge aegeria aegeria]